MKYSMYGFREKEFMLRTVSVLHESLQDIQHESLRIIENILPHVASLET